MFPTRFSRDLICEVYNFSIKESDISSSIKAKSQLDQKNSRNDRSGGWFVENNRVPR